MGKKVHVKTSISLWWRMLTVVITELILLSTVTACISFNVTEAAVSKGLRAWIESKSGFLGKLTHCGYCFGFWVALIMEFTFRIQLFDTWILLDYALTTLVITWISGFQWIFMCCLMKFAGK